MVCSGWRKENSTASGFIKDEFIAGEAEPDVLLGI